MTSIRLVVVTATHTIGTDVYAGQVQTLAEHYDAMPFVAEHARTSARHELTNGIMIKHPELTLAQLKNVFDTCTVTETRETLDLSEAGEQP